MRIDRLRAHNFRCFENQTFVFDADVTVLIGKNGSGRQPRSTRWRSPAARGFTGSAANERRPSSGLMFAS